MGARAAWLAPLLLLFSGDAADAGAVPAAERPRPAPAI
jgi:hypothetical protein